MQFPASFQTGEYASVSFQQAGAISDRGPNGIEMIPTDRFPSPAPPPSIAALKQQISAMRFQLGKMEKLRAEDAREIKRLQRENDRLEKRNADNELENQRLKGMKRMRDQAIREAEKVREATRKDREEAAIALNERATLKARVAWLEEQLEEAHEADELETEFQEARAAKLEELEREIVDMARTVIKARREEQAASDALARAEREIERLRKASGDSGAEAAFRREIARLKAELAEARKASASKAGGPTIYFNGKETDFARKLKALFAKMFHTDAGSGSADEQKLRTEIFKIFWTELQKITKQASA